MAERYRVAVVGCGIGRSHIEEAYALQEDLYEVVALCELDEARMTSVGDEFGVARRETSFANVLSADVDIVDICTPPTTHKEMILAALAVGKHVVCEKPLVGSLADIDDISRAEKQARGKLMPIFQYRWGDGAQRAKRIVDAGIAGKPYVGTVETHWRRDAVYYDNPWRGRWSTELGGVLTTHAIHIHDLLSFFLGPVARVFARTATRVNKIETEDCVAASLAMECGALVTTSATLGSHVEISRMRLCFENVTIETGLAPYSPADEPWTVTPANPDVAARIAEATQDFASEGRRFGGQMRAFHASLAAGVPPPVTTADARRSLELLTAFYTSAAEDRDVTLPLAKNHPNYMGLRPAA